MLGRCIGWVLACLLLLPTGALAQGDVCDEGDVYSGEGRYLRSLSLDLRGYAPSPEEYALLEAEGGLDAVLDEWLQDDLFVERAVRFHQSLLWNNVTDLRLIINQRTLSTSGSLYYSGTAAQAFRGARVPCLDEPAEFDEAGYPITKLQSDGTTLEGYVWVNPYWAPDTPIKVCAFDAQERAVTSSGLSCEIRSSLSQRECGCGPELQRCAYRTITIQPTLESFAEDTNRRVRDIIGGDIPYTELFTHQYAWVNGPIVDYWTHRSEFYQGFRTSPSPMPMERLPDLDYLDVDTWVKVPLEDNAAGILTSPAYLMRFQTNRARANRFYNAFLCQPFQPPEGGIPIVDDGSFPTLDLQERDGCKYCHAILEPSSAYWGRWIDQGAGYLDDTRFPAFSESCDDCARGGASCSADCKAFYVVDPLTDEEEPWLGWLRSYEFRRDEHHSNVERGPGDLAKDGIVDGRLPRCVSRQTATWLLGREILPEEEPWLEEIALDFIRNDYTYRHLVRSILTSETYRRVE